MLLGWGGEMLAGLVWSRTPVLGAVLCRALYFSLRQVHAGVEIKAGRREGMKKEKKKEKQVKPDQAGSV